MGEYEVLLGIVRSMVAEHGPIDFVESNGEHWLEVEGRLRDDLGIEGLTARDVRRLRSKLAMAEAFESGGRALHRRASAACRRRPSRASPRRTACHSSSSRTAVREPRRPSGCRRKAELEAALASAPRRPRRAALRRGRHRDLRRPGGPGRPRGVLHLPCLRPRNHGGENRRSRRVLLLASRHSAGARAGRPPGTRRVRPAPALLPPRILRASGRLVRRARDERAPPGRVHDRHDQSRLRLRCVRVVGRRDAWRVARRLFV